MLTGWEPSRVLRRGDTVNALSAQHLEQGRSQLWKISLMGLLTVLVSLVALGQGSSENLNMWTTVQVIFRGFL